jgi:gluconolactonase
MKFGVRHCLLLGAVLLWAAAAQAQDFSTAVTQRLIGGYAYAEAPTWSREGFFLWADVPESKIWKWIPGAQPTLFRDKSEKVIGAAYDAKGDLYLCESATGRVMRLPVKGGSAEVVAFAWDGKRLNSPNSVVIRKDGHVYFTDPAFGSADAAKKLDFYGVYHVDPDPKNPKPLSIVAKPKGRPNGITLSPDGRKLYIANSDEHALYVYDLAAKTGEASNQRVLISKIPGVPGGITTDEKGNIYIAARGVQVYSPEGKLLHTFEYTEQPSDVAFGGGEFNQLMVTAGSAIYLTEMPVKGAQY